MLTEWLTITGIASLGIISPGPGFAVAFRNSLRHGRKIGISTAFGIASGDSVHVFINLLGIAKLLSYYPKTAILLQFCGGMYLLYLGLKGLFLNELNIPTQITNSSRSCISGFWEGLLVTALNPKAILFWLGVFSVIIPPTTSITVRLSIGAWIALLSSSWFIIVALCVTQKSFNAFFAKHMQRIERVISIALILIALNVLKGTEVKELLALFGTVN